MKEQFITKWSNWWQFNENAKQLNEAFEKELNEVIENQIALILKAAKMEMDRLEGNKDEVAYTEMRQAGSRAKLRYVAFFDKMKDLLTDKDLTNVVTESELIREIMVKQIEKLIIERGV